MKVQCTFNMLRRLAVCIITVCSLVPLNGCFVDGGTVSGSISQNQQTGATTVTVTGTISIKTGTPKFGLWAPMVSGADLASLDASQAIMNYSLSNATIVSTGGPVTVTVTDGTTGSTLGQETFQYVVRNQSLFAADPNAVSTWLNQFASSSNVNVTVAANTD